MLWPIQKRQSAPVPLQEQPRKALPAPHAPELHEQLTELLGEVWAAEDEWRLDDRIAMRAKNEGW